MNDPKCELMRLAAMALADGETSTVPSAEIAAHLQNCAECRNEVAQLHSLTQQLDATQRHASAVDLWRPVAGRLKAESPGPAEIGFAGLFLQLAVLLLSCQGLVWISGTFMGMVVRLLTLASIALLFIGYRVNPFAVQENLHGIPEVNL